MNLRKLNDTTYPICFLMVDSADHIAGKTGLAPTVTIAKNGGAFGSAAGAVTELGSGWYCLEANATDRNTLGGLAIHAAATGADPTDIYYSIVAYNPYSATDLGLTNLNAPVGSIPTAPLLAVNYTAPDNSAIAAIKAKVDSYLDAAISAVLAAVSAISGSRVTVVSPISSSGDVTIQIGDDYYSADGRALVWTSASWPTLTGGSAVLNVDGASTSVTLDNATKTATVELSSSFTGAIPAGVYHFEILATLANGHIVTLVSGNMTAE